MEIARAAAALFVRQGLRGTRAEDIAQAAGIAPRTFYRYFASKEEAVAPLYAAGAELCIQAVRDAPPGLSVPEALRHAVEYTLSPGVGVSAASWEWVRTLIRLADASPALGKVWAEVCRMSESALAETLAERLAPADSGEAAASGAHRDSAERAESAEDDVARPPAVPPHLRLTAAVAGAAIRVAVESWATTTYPPTGPDGPATLALRNLTALENYAWPETSPSPGS
ncbi:TetR/AcrR family transcriptional regulator [Streptomyces sp. NPDC002386]